MTDNADLHVVFGANGGAGGAIVRALVARGKPVRGVTRSGRGELPAGVERVAADAANPADAIKAATGAAVIYHTVNVPYPAWAETLPPVMHGLIAAASGVGAKLVYADNLYAYGPVDRPMTEDLPPAATTRKGRLRAELAKTLLAAHRAGTVRAVIGRASDYYGPGVVNSVAGDRLFPAVRQGKRARWPGSLEQPHSLTYIDDFARALATLGERDEALGEVWHAPPAEALTGREFLTLAFAEAGRSPRLGAYPRWLLQLVGLLDPTVRELDELAYEFEEPFVLDGGKHLAAFGGAPTPHRQAIRATLAWYAARERAAPGNHDSAPGPAEGKPW